MKEVLVKSLGFILIVALGYILKKRVFSDVDKKVNFNQYCIDEKHIVSVCSKEESFPSIIKDININDILL